MAMQSWRPTSLAQHVHEALALGLAAVLGAVLVTLLLSGTGLLSSLSGPEAVSDDPIARVYLEANPGVVSVVDRGQPRAEPPDFVRGSGFVIDLNGHVLTNYHVVKGALDLGVLLSDGVTYRADLVGNDPSHDLAVLKVEVPPERLHPLALGDSGRLAVGQRVIALGSPFGLDQTLTLGVVSFLGRRVEAEGKLKIEQAIQTDAALNPGNSGGPLLDLKGKVIGVNARSMLGAIGDGDQGSAGVGFAIPVNAVKPLLSEMIEGELRAKPWLGITVRDSKASEPEGAKVVLVIAGGSAAEAKLEGAGYFSVREDGTLGESGDVITALDGLAVRSPRDLASHLAGSGKAVGDTVALSVARGDERLEISVRLRACDPGRTDAI